jgi:hypothetical protein
MFRSSLLACVIVLGACGDDGPVQVPDASEIVPLPWWTPAPGEFHNWDIQLNAPFKIDGDLRAMMVLDLFKVVPADTVVDYGDGAPVTFPAGALPAAIADLHARGTIVVCHVNVGAINPLTDPDAAKFPVAIRGAKTMNPNDAEELFVDIRPTERAMWATALTKRIELAKAVGCDAIDADKSLQSAGVQPGWVVSAAEQKTFDLAVAELVHGADVELAIGLHNAVGFGADPDLVAAYDFAISEDMLVAGACCEEVRVFLNVGKAGFALDRLSDVSKDSACITYTAQMMQDGLLKDDALSSASREICP